GGGGEGRDGGGLVEAFGVAGRGGQPPPEGGAVDVEVGEQADGPADRLGAPAVLGSVGRQRHRRQLLTEEVETGRGRLADGTRGDIARPPVADRGEPDAGRRGRREHGVRICGGRTRVGRGGPGSVSRFGGGAGFRRRRHRIRTRFPRNR